MEFVLIPRRELEGEGGAHREHGAWGEGGAGSRTLRFDCVIPSPSLQADASIYGN